MMNDLPRMKLAELLRAEGNSLLNDPQRLYFQLQSAYPQSPTEVVAIMGALRQGAPASLLSAAANPSVPWATVTSSWSQRLQEQERMSPEAAVWAIDSWAMALGVGPIAAPSSFSGAGANLGAPQNVPGFPSPGAPPPPRSQSVWVSVPPPPVSAMGNVPQQAPPIFSQTPPPQPVPQPFPPQTVPMPPAPKSGKAGPIILVGLLIIIAIGCWYFFVRANFDGALVGDWRNSMADGSATWNRSWHVTTFGSYTLTETLSDAGTVEVLDNEKTLVLHSDHAGRIDAHYRIENQEKIFFSGPVVGPYGPAEYDWSTVDRGVPEVDRITFVGSWITSIPVDGLTGNMKLTIDYNFRYTFEASYRGSGSMTAKHGQSTYEILTGSGTLTDSGTYTVDNADQIEFVSNDPKRGRMTWNKSH
ncbi:MAG TPA: hypothetical protein VN774_03250 [Candidatus Limnocylindrales bacterium]|nr:hypothetical protein [Candidatus Limnocylindrales bacterium]